MKVQKIGWTLRGPWRTKLATVRIFLSCAFHLKVSTENMPGQKTQNFFNSWKNNKKYLGTSKKFMSTYQPDYMLCVNKNCYSNSTLNMTLVWNILCDWNLFVLKLRWNWWRSHLLSKLERRLNETCNTSRLGIATKFRIHLTGSLIKLILNSVTFQCMDALWEFYAIMENYCEISKNIFDWEKHKIWECLKKRIEVNLLNQIYILEIK